MANQLLTVFQDFVWSIIDRGELQVCPKEAGGCGNGWKVSGSMADFIYLLPA